MSPVIVIGSVAILVGMLLRAEAVGGVGGVSGSDSGPGRRCQEITVPICKGIGYNLTYMPNQFSHDTQEEAGLEVHQFWPLVEIQCSPDLRFFLCSMYAPICIPNYQKPLPACRSVCERARNGCAPVMLQYGFAWPERMRCEDLPEYGDKHRLCMDVNSTATSAAKTPGPPTGRSSSGLPSQPGIFSSPSTTRKSTIADDGAGGPEMSSCPCSTCQAPLIPITDTVSHLYGRVSTGGITNCAAPCGGIHFGVDERRFARLWIGVWSALCIASTTATLATFAVDRRRFRYPERAIIMLSGCYLFVAVGYVVGVLVNSEAVSCERYISSVTSSDTSSHLIDIDDGDIDTVTSRRQGRVDLIVRYHSTGPVACTIVFLLVYYFGMASCLWWVILTFTWFLSAGLKWSHEAISANAQYFHFIAFLVPAIQTIAALAMSVVDGDPLSGICYVGNQDITALRAFVLGPLCAYLLIGTCFLVAGFVSMIRIRRSLRQQQQQQLSGTCSTSSAVVVSSEKLDRFMVRIGVVSVFYTVPASTVVACLFYEQHFRDGWDRARACYGCHRADDAGQHVTVSGSTMAVMFDRPDFSVFALKYFACIVVGITSGFWIWTRKTVDSWRARCCDPCCRVGSRPKTGNKMAAATVSVDTRGIYDEIAVPQSGAVASGKSFLVSRGASAPFVYSGGKHSGKQAAAGGLLQQQLTVDGLKTPSLYSQL